MSKNVLLEYIWLDGYATANLRSKVKVIALDADIPTLADCPVFGTLMVHQQNRRLEIVQNVF